MTNNVWLISNINGSITNYYLSNDATVEYAGSGTPWTAQSTTPFRIAMNDTVGSRYTPQAAPATEIYSGGPPFRPGRSLMVKSRDNVTEPITIQMKANSHDNAVALKHLLTKVLNTALFTVPCILAFQPDGSSNIAYYEIFSADVQEDPRFINDEAPLNFIRALVTWRRSPFAGMLSSGETVINAATFANTGTGSPDNVEAYSAASGELIYEGQPLNIKVTPANVASNPLRKLYAASILSRTYSTSSAGAYSTTSTTTPVTFVAGITFSASSLIANNGLKVRVLMRFSGLNSAIELRASIWFTDVVYRSGWIAGGGTTNLIDFGGFDLDMVRRSKGITAPAFDVVLEGRSTDGTNATATLTYTEVLFYYDFAVVDPINLNANGSNFLLLDSFQEQTNAPCLPHPYEQAITSTGTDIDSLPPKRGRFPRYYSGASLYLGWLDGPGANPDHTTTRQATVTATVAPLWLTMRGGD